MLFEICPLTMRTQNILLVRDTVVTLNLRPTDGRHRFHLLLPHPLIVLRDCQNSRLVFGGNHAINL